MLNNILNFQGLKLGESSCLKVVLEMITPANQGTYMLPPRLHCACVKLLNALWVDKRHSALQVCEMFSAKIISLQFLYFRYRCYILLVRFIQFTFYLFRLFVRLQLMKVWDFGVQFFIHYSVKTHRKTLPRFVLFYFYFKSSYLRLGNTKLCRPFFNFAILYYVVKIQLFDKTVYFRMNCWKRARTSSISLPMIYSTRPIPNLTKLLPRF